MRVTAQKKGRQLPFFCVGITRLAAMATYAIGDLQGCWHTLESLLRHIRYQPRRDTLWFVGDLVNRGTGSLECLRFVASLKSNAVTVLGNHDLHLLAVAEGFAKPHRLDTLGDILNAPDAARLLNWLRQQKLLHLTSTHALVHAALMPQWSWRTARALAHEVEARLQSVQYRQLLKQMYSNEPLEWREDLATIARQRFVINTMTRVRTLSSEGAHQHGYKGTLEAMPAGFRAWFTLPTVRRRRRKIIAGHWSALGLYQSDDFIGIDSGCVWGRMLTAYRIDDARVFQVASAEMPTRSGVLMA